MLKFLAISVLCALLSQVSSQYEANWDSLDTRPLPEWYDKAKIGIFLHWGVYSVPSFGSEWFWYSWKASEDQNYIDFMKANYPPNFTYQDFGKELTAEFFNPSDWASLFEASGAKYVILTSKHHEGYAMWPSRYSYSWNSQDVGPHRDLLGDLAAAVRDKDLHFGVYHSLLEWFHPLYEDDKANDWNTTAFTDAKIIPEMKELVNTYKPEIIWSDGNWESPDTYWKSTEFLAWLYNESPVKDEILVNDRWGSSTMCNHGDFFTCADRYTPGHLLPKKWENAMTLDKNSWGYRRQTRASDVLTINELLETVVETISFGGNILINVGPTKEGTIIPIFEERLLQLGRWLGVNGEAIYESVPWTAQNDTLTKGVWYTARADAAVYAIVLDWPQDNKLKLGSVSDLTNQDVQITLLGNEDLLIEISEINDNEGIVTFSFPDKAKVVSEWAWVLKFKTSGKK